MQQTILALAAILIFSIYALNRHEADAGRERIGISDEVETAAAAIARERIHVVLSRAYDEADVEREGARTSSTGLTPTASFGPEAGEASEADYDDVDDFHSQVVARTAGRNGQTLRFEETTTVQYIDPVTSAPAASPTLAKEVTVLVRTLLPGGDPVVARLRRVVTAASAGSSRLS